MALRLSHTLHHVVNGIISGHLGTEIWCHYPKSDLLSMFREFIDTFFCISVYFII